MNPAMPQTTPGRKADLNPFNCSVVAAPRQAVKAASGSTREVKRAASAEYGCVDWYRYQAGEDNKITH